MFSAISGGKISIMEFHNVFLEAMSDNGVSKCFLEARLNKGVS